MGVGFFRAVIKAFDTRQYDSLSFTKACIYWLWNIAPKRTQSFEFMSIYFIWSYFLLVYWRNYDQIVKKVQFSASCLLPFIHPDFHSYTSFCPSNEGNENMWIIIIIVICYIRTLSIQIPHDFDWLWFSQYQETKIINREVRQKHI